MHPVNPKTVKPALTRVLAWMHRPPAGPDPQFPLSPFPGAPRSCPRVLRSPNQCHTQKLVQGPLPRPRQPKPSPAEKARQPKKPETSITIEFVFDDLHASAS
ncbi:uncharacterized protein K441DRAFT_740871, partial [Cenococcum geophilum 1.58]|uniref:uncharacterized protein n=1 Tax=Cenococcum geophilum 1.58 TaxID=794803 RepID=UPI00358E235C